MKDIALTIVTRFLFPYIILFGLYILIHGEISPGGGFQSGAILASSMMLYTLTFGIDRTIKLVPIEYLKKTAIAGMIVYVGVGIVTIVLGGNFLSFDYLAASNILGQKIGIIIVEVAIATVVASGLTMIFLLLVNR